MSDLLKQLRDNPLPKPLWDFSGGGLEQESGDKLTLVAGGPMSDTKVTNHVKVPVLTEQGIKRIIEYMKQGSVPWRSGFCIGNEFVEHAKEASMSKQLFGKVVDTDIDIRTRMARIVVEVPIDAAFQQRFPKPSTIKGYLMDEEVALDLDPQGVKLDSDADEEYIDLGGISINGTKVTLELGGSDDYAKAARIGMHSIARRVEDTDKILADALLGLVRRLDIEDEESRKKK